MWAARRCWSKRRAGDCSPTRRSIPRAAGTRSGGGRRRASSPARRSRPPTLGPIDAVLLSHDHHDDNLDAAGRAFLPAAGTVVTTAAGRAAGWAAGARGLAPWVSTAPRGARPAADRDHRHALPPRPAAEPPDRRRRHRLRAALGGPGARRALDLRGHGPLRRRARGRRARGRRDRRGAPRRRAVPGDRTGALHDDRARRGRAVLADRPHTIVPIHYEGWRHFRQGREGSSASSRARRTTWRGRVHWLEIGAREALGI